MKLKTFFANVSQHIKKIAGIVWGSVSHNLGLKLVSLFLAVLLWNFVISSNVNITRTKTITGLSGTVTGQSLLTNYGIALVDDPAAALGSVSVVIEVPRANFSDVTSRNVSVELDLSGIRNPGVQDVPLRASSNYGRVVRVVPESLELTFDTLDSRQIPVNVQVNGGDDAAEYWYNVSRTNPSMLTISGAAATVQQITSAYAYVDVTGATEDFTAAVRYELVNEEGVSIESTRLSRSSTSISVSVEVCPMRNIPISTEVAKVVDGQPAEGYVVESVSIQPESLMVAADSDVLAGLNELHIETVSVEGRSQSFSVRSDVETLSAFRYLSADEVYVSVVIAEAKVTDWIDNVTVNYINTPAGLTLVDAPETVRIYAAGPGSVIEDLKNDGMVLTVDLTGLTAGSHDLDPAYPDDLSEDVTLTLENGVITVNLENAAAQN